MISDAGFESVVGRQCKLLKPVRDHQGRTRFGEHPKIVRELINLGRRMYLVEFEDRATTFLFPNEIAIE